MLKAGLHIVELAEPLPPKEWQASSPGRYESYMETPVCMMMKVAK